MQPPPPSPEMNQEFLPLLLASLVVVAGIRGCVCQTQNDYETCSHPFVCGSLRDIGYPFYGGSRPPSCGHPGFELKCQNGVPITSTSSIIYQIHAIDNHTQTIKVSRNDAWGNLCAPLLFNTTPYRFYSAADDQDVTVIYGCSSAQLSPPMVASQLTCNGSGIDGAELGPIPGTGVTCVGPRISVRVNRTAAEQLAASNSTAVLLPTSLQSGFSMQWSAENRSCTRCARSGGFCGFSQTSQSFACHCAHGSYQSICPDSANQNRSGNGHSDLQKFVIIGVSLGVPGLVISFITIFCIIKQYRLLYVDQEKSNQNVEKFLLTYGSLAPKRYSYNEIKSMTKSFRDKLGQGGYGIVYKGELPDGQLVAVKVLTDIHENAEDFINEVASISRTSHVNIVNLLGFCYQRKKRALVYEFMANKSLDKFTYKRGSTHPECSLEMDKLYEIALGVAQGLDYLHRGCNTKIVHFDIKPQNILLDEFFCPKISDFGLAKLCKKKQSKISMFGARGTIGYIAPEVFSRNFGAVSHKSDVYSYGMMLLEMAEAREMAQIEPIQSSENYFPENIYEHVLLKIKTLDDVVTGEKEETEIKMLMVGLWCIQTAPSDRPSMSKVVEMLEGSLQSIQIPPKPFFSSLDPLHISSSLNLDIEIST